MCLQLSLGFIIIVWRKAVNSSLLNTIITINHNCLERCHGNYCVANSDCHRVSLALSAFEKKMMYNYITCLFLIMITWSLLFVKFQVWRIVVSQPDPTLCYTTGRVCSTLGTTVCQEFSQIFGYFSGWQTSNNIHNNYTVMNSIT